MTKAEAIILLQDVLEYQTSKGQRIVWLTDENVKSIIEVIKRHDVGCENCEIAIESRQKIVMCKDCKYGEPCKNMRGEHGVFCYNSQSANKDWVHEPNWFCADGEDKQGR